MIFGAVIHECSVVVDKTMHKKVCADFVAPMFKDIVFFCMIIVA